MKRLFNVSLILILALCAFGCSNLMDDDIVQKETSKSVVEIASTYTQNISKWALLRAANDPEHDDYFYLFKDIPEVDYTVLSDEEKDEIIRKDRESFLVCLLEKLEEDADLIEDLALENAAFALTESVSNRSADFTDCDFDTLYIENMNSLFAKKQAQNRSSGTTSGSAVTITESFNSSSKTTFLNNMKTGYILVVHGDEDSNWTLGHTSMMLGYTYSDNDLTMGTITSFPKNGHERYTWAGQEHGVQYEPIAYWTGESKGARNVKLFKMYHDKLNKNEATKDEYAAAVAFAESKIGRPYPPYVKQGIFQWTPYEFAKYKDSDTYYYCSSLVRTAWLKTAGINMWPNYPFVSPGDIGASAYTKKVTSWTNY